ncbi:MAG: NADH-quinone oxidoreductase subunit E [Myxococcales bacterium]|nr:NADH-quinone oxidoreductase subunit E [Myxococcales bacterium]
MGRNGTIISALTSANKLVKPNRTTLAGSFDISTRVTSPASRGARHRVRCAREPNVSLSAPETDAVNDAIAACAALAGACLPLLHHLHDALGYVPPGAVPGIARALNLSQADVHGVISFYHDFRSAPPRRHVVRLCRAEACQAMGGEALALLLKRVAPPDVTLEPVYCLGLCASAPAGMIDGHLVARLSPARLDKVLSGFAEER